MLYFDSPCTWRCSDMDWRMRLSIQLHLLGLSLSNTVRVCEVFGVQRAWSTVNNWVLNVDLQPKSGKNPDHIVVDETVIQLNDQQYWLYAAVDTDTNELLHTTLETTRKTMIAQQFLTNMGKRNDVFEAVLFIDGAQSLHAACHRIGYDFRYKKHGNRNAVERVFREIKRRTICFTNCFSNATAETADNWIKSLSFAWNQLIWTLPYNLV